MAHQTHDRGPEFDGVKIGRPATGAIIDAGYQRLTDLPDDLDEPSCCPLTAPWRCAGFTLCATGLRVPT